MHFPIESDFEDDKALLAAFVRAYRDHLRIVLGARPPGDYRMPQISPRLQGILGDEGRAQLERDFEDLLREIDRVSPGVLLKHGLIGSHLRFKIAALNDRERRLYRDGVFIFKPVFGKSLGDLADTIIDSALEATGAGTTIREIGDVATDVIGDTIDS